MLSGSRNVGLIFIVILLAGFSSSTAAASKVTISSSPQILSSGDIFTVDVFVEPDVAIAGMQFSLEFDESKLNVVEVTEGDLFRQSGLGTFFNNGTVGQGMLTNVYGTILGASNVSTPAAFASIILVVEPQEEFTSTLNLKNVIISDPDGNAVVVEVMDAIIEVMSIYDVNGDGAVDLTDYGIIDEHFSETTSFPYPRWDVNSDGIVNVQDLRLITFNLG
ncbi:MAG: cohesin domain-containing protein [Methanosarcinales archaeon]|nr:cohesin domain-containing protein [Methanosarcinales archaeon]